MQTEQPTKVPFHYREKPNSLSNVLKQNSLIKQNGFTPEETLAWGTTLLDTLFFFKETVLLSFL